MSNRPKNVRRMNYTILPPKKPKQRRSMLRKIKEHLRLTNEHKFGKEEFYD